jgi:hypothetical protein
MICKILVVCPSSWRSCQESGGFMPVFYIQKSGRLTCFKEKPYPELSWRLNTVVLFWGGWETALKECDWIHERWREYLQLTISHVFHMNCSVRTSKSMVSQEIIDDIRRNPFK